jgi:hypothetical protein
MVSMGFWTLDAYKVVEFIPRTKNCGRSQKMSVISLTRHFRKKWLKIKKL